MTDLMQMGYKIDRKYDPKKSRHYINDIVTVLHCHHYLTLYTQLADDAKQFDGIKHLRNAAEETFYPILSEYFKTNELNDVEEKIFAVEEYWRIAGMGLLKFKAAGDFSATVDMAHSHIDEGWIKKWGTREEPVNYVTQGFLNAAMAVINDMPLKSFDTNEIQSKVSGADKSIFHVIRK